MRTNTLRRSCLYIFLLIAMTSAIDGISADQQPTEGNATGLTAVVTLPDGTTQIVTLDGVGCSISICSRVFIRGKSNGATANIRLEKLAAVTDVTQDSALFVMKDGTQQRLSFLPDFRVLYINGRGRGDKLDLSKIRSLKMSVSAK